MKRSTALFAIGVLLTATAAAAHHSFAAYYDEGKHVSLEGQVVSFELRSPHAWVYFMAPDGSGVMRKFGAEWGNPRRLSQQGIDAQTLRAGDRIVVGGAPNRKSEDYTVHLKSIRRMSDGWSWPSGGGNGRRGRFR